MKTTLLTGTGAVENGWQPVITALRRVIANTPENDPDLVLAYLVNQLRWLTFQKRQEGPDRGRFVHLFDERLRVYEDLKKAIADELVLARRSGFIRHRAQLSAVESRFFTFDMSVITTNWDLTVKDFVQGRWPITHLHGSVSDPSSLYLPTEAIVEPYREGSPESSLHGDFAGTAMRRLEETERLIIYGLRLSPLDPELGLILSEGFHGTKNPREVIIVDLDPKGVAQRLRFYAPRVLPHLFKPDELREPA